MAIEYTPDNIAYKGTPVSKLTREELETAFIDVLKQFESLHGERDRERARERDREFPSKYTRKYTTEDLFFGTIVSIVSVGFIVVLCIGFFMSLIK